MFSSIVAIVLLAGQLQFQACLASSQQTFNIGAILSNPAHIFTFVREIELFNNHSKSASGDHGSITLQATAFQMSSNPIHTAQDVCDKLIAQQVFAVIVSHPEHEFQSPTSVSFTCGFYNIPVIGISNRDSSLSNKNLHWSFLRTIPPYSHQADVWVEMLRALHYRNVVFIHSADADGHGVLSRFQDLADKSGIKVDSFIEYEPGRPNIIRELQVVRENLYCRVFMLYASAQDAEVIFEEVRKHNMDSSNYAWIVSEQAVKAVNRFNGILSLDLKNSEESLMIKDSVGVLANALQELIHETNFTNPPSSCLQSSGQKWSTGSDFYRKLIKQQYNGQSGRIVFDESGDRLLSEFNILNLQNNEETVVGKYFFNSQTMNKELTLESSNILWPGNSRNQPMGYHVPKHLRVATLPEKPFVWATPIPANESECVEPGQVFCPRYNLMNDTHDNYCCSGYCIDLLVDLSRSLNFTYDLEIVPDGQYGTFEFADGLDKPRRWTGLVGDLVYKRIDMAVAPLTANPERSQVISFSKPFKYEGITILQKRQPHKATLASFLQPFQNTLWILVLVSVHVVALALYLLDRFSPFGGFKFDDYSCSDEHALNLSSAIWFSWGVLLNSGIGERTPRSFSARVLGMVWAGFAMIVVASYTANLAAFLVLNPRDDHAVSGIEDARLRNPTESFTFGTVKGSSVDMFFRSQVHLFNAYRTMEETNRVSPEDAIQALKNGELDAFIWDSPRLEYEAAQDCELTISGELFGRSGYSIGLQKNSFWTDSVTLSLLRMHESGFMESLDNKWILPNENECDKVSDNFPYTLGMKNMAGVFILVFSGIIVSFGLIVIEIVYKKRKTRKIRRLTIAKRMAIRWIIKTRRNKARQFSRQKMIASKSSLVLSAPTLQQSQQQPFLIKRNKTPVLLHDSSSNFSTPEPLAGGFIDGTIPPPPPPPSSRFIPTTSLSTKQRTAQQKIYEYKHHRPFGAF